MPSADELWAWLRTPLQELASERARDRDKPWEELRAYFLSQLGLHNSTDHPLADGLLTRLDEQTADERGATLDDSGKLETLGYEFATRFADQQGGPARQQGGQESQSYDEGAWRQFLVENGPRWAGTDDTWSQFSEWFAYQANQSGVGTPAAALIHHLAAQNAQDRIATLAQYGVTITAPVTAAAATSQQSYDEGAWRQFLVENGPRWAGTDDTWSQFSEWFIYQANQSGVGAPAAALIQHLAAQNVQDRIATLAQYGVTVTAPAASAGPATSAQPVALTEENVQSLLDETAGFDDIPEERRRELIRQAATGL